MCAVIPGILAVFLKDKSMPGKASNKSTGLRKILVLSAVSFVFYLATLVLAASSLYQITINLIPVQDAAMEVRSHINLGYLWFEKALDNDVDEGISMVRDDFNQAEWYLKALKRR